MPVSQKLRKEILDELRSVPHKTKGFKDEDYKRDPDLFDTLKEMELSGEVLLNSPSSRIKIHGVRPPNIVKLLPREAAD